MEVDEPQSDAKEGSSKEDEEGDKREPYRVQSPDIVDEKTKKPTRKKEQKEKREGVDSLEIAPIVAIRTSSSDSLTPASASLQSSGNFPAAANGPNVDRQIVRSLFPAQPVGYHR